MLLKKNLIKIVRIDKKLHKMVIFFNIVPIFSLFSMKYSCISDFSSKNNQII